jgi:hypothetical protein
MAQKLDEAFGNFAVAVDGGVKTVVGDVTGRDGNLEAILEVQKFFALGSAEGAVG